MPAPYIVNSYSSNYTSAGTSKSVNVDYQAGDSLLIYVLGDTSVNISSPSGTGLAFRGTLVSNNNGTYGTLIFYRMYQLATGATGNTITVNDSVGTNAWGFTCHVVRNAYTDKIIASTTGTGTPNASFVRSFGTRSLLFTFITDSSAQDGSSRAWNAPFGTSPSAGNGRELTYSYSSGSFTAYAAYDISNSPSYVTFGLAQPGSMTYSMGVFEILGDDSVQEEQGSSAGYTATTSVTANHTSTEEVKNKVIFAAVYVGVQPANGTDSGVTTTVTYDGNPMTSLAKIHSNGGSQGYVELFYYINPPYGFARPVVATASTSVDLKLYVRTLHNCNLANPFAEIKTTSGTGTAASLSFTNVSPRDAIFYVVASGQGLSSPSTSSTGNDDFWARQNFNTSSDAGCAGLITVVYPSATSSLSWNMTSGPYAMIGVRLSAGSYLPPNAVVYFKF